MIRRWTFRTAGAAALAISFTAAAAQEGESDDAELAKKLANPIASLISVPIQFNYDGGYGPLDGERAFANIQPVIPFDLTDDLSLVTRTIVPVVWQNDIAGASGVQFGLGDTLQSFFFVPRSTDTSLGTLTWGAGPAVLWPTSTDRLLGAGTLGLGPTAVALVQSKGWTWGALVNHLWGVADTRGGVPALNNTYVQPFLSYTTPSAWTFTLNSESSYNWTAEDGAIPINAVIAKMVDIDGQRVQFLLGARYWAESARGGPDGWGARAAVVLLFPK